MTVSPIVYTFMFVSICCYSFGAYLHLRIIKVSRKDKELTWKLDVMNSVIILIMQFNNLSVKILTYGVTDLYLYTGEWFCYASKVIAFYSTTYVVGHSLIISILKYIMIVHWAKVRDWGNKKIVTIFSGVDILHPILLILIWLSIRPDFFWAHDGYAQIDRCLGDPKDVWNDAYDELLPNRSLTKTHNLCQFVGATQSSNLESAIHIFKTCLCWVVVAWYYLTSFNIFEILAYCSTFRYISRQLKNPPTADEVFTDRQKQSIQADLKRFHVNAQVTFMISILEILGCVTQVVLLVVFKTGTFPTLINGIFLWSIVLPYAFLMNTSHNKQRIIQSGWANIFKNVFKLPNNQILNASDQPQNEVNKPRSLGVVSTNSALPHTHLKRIKTKSLSTCTLNKNRSADPNLNLKSLKQLNKKHVTLETPEVGYGTLDVLSLVRVNKHAPACKFMEQDLVLTDLEQESNEIFNFKDQ